MSDTHRPGWDQPLDSSLYAPDEEAKTFMKTLMGIQDDEELKRHVLAMQAKAFELYKYPCIRLFDFVKLKIARLPAYSQFIKLGHEREGAIVLDVGCCFGNDIRKAVLDGWPVQNVVVCDLSQKLWDLGHELFRSTTDTFPVAFLEGDIMDPSFLALSPPLVTADITPLHPVLSTVRALGELQGQLSAIFAGLFFHLFDFNQQEHVARLLAGLLSPLPGSMLFGAHGGRAEKGIWRPAEGNRMHCHSPESWRELWEGIFAEAGVQVRVDASLRMFGGSDMFGTYQGNTDGPFHALEWSVTRL